MATPALALSRLRVAAATRPAVLFAVVAVAALAVAVRAPFFLWPLIDDEGAYAYTAYWWSRGLTLYSDELWFDKPQAIFVAYKAGSLLLGDATWAIRLWAACWAAGTTVVVWLIARRLFDGRVAVTAALLYALFSAHTHIDGYSANAKVFMLLPATLSAYYLLRGLPAAAGLAASAAVVLKPSGAGALLLAAAWFAYTRAGWRHWLRFAVASAALPVVALAHGILTVGLRDYLDAVVWQRFAVARPNPLTAAARALVNTFPVWAPLGSSRDLGCRCCAGARGSSSSCGCSPRWPESRSAATGGRTISCSSCPRSRSWPGRGSAASGHRRSRGAGWGWRW